MKTIARVLFLAALAPGSGCARSDGIEQTLVTVDVAGVWSGEVRSRSTMAGTTLTGSFVMSGSVGLIAGSASTSGPIEGTVAGDVFRFTQTALPAFVWVAVST